MNGFKDNSFNLAFRDHFYREMKNFFIFCIKEMVRDAHLNNKTLPNHENKLRNILVYEYLRNDLLKSNPSFNNLQINFETEAPESYIEDTNELIGKTDIKITNIDTLNHSNDYYYTVECKRLDGYSSLNKAYVSEGVERFIGTNVKYPSIYKKNLMFGMIVKDIDIDENTMKINELQNTDVGQYIDKELEIESNSFPEYRIYSGNYHAGSDIITLEHLFYDFSSVIRV